MIDLRLELERRAGLPEDLRFLAEKYPRDEWQRMPTSTAWPVSGCSAMTCSAKWAAC